MVYESLHHFCKTVKTWLCSPRGVRHRVYVMVLWTCRLPRPTNGHEEQPSITSVSDVSPSGPCWRCSSHCWATLLQRPWGKSIHTQHLIWATTDGSTPIWAKSLQTHCTGCVTAEKTSIQSTKPCADHVTMWPGPVFVLMVELEYSCGPVCVCLVFVWCVCWTFTHWLNSPTHLRLWSLTKEKKQTTICWQWVFSTNWPPKIPK